MPDLERLASDIAAAGTRHLFGITGSGPSLALCDALEKLGVVTVRTQFEGSAALMAGTGSRLNGKPGVALSIKGPGVANLLPGITACSYENFPLVAISEAYPPGSSAALAHKRLDHARMLSPVTKAVQQITSDGRGFPEIWDLACSELPGPVMLELAGDGCHEVSCLDAQSDIGVSASAVLDQIAGSSRPIVIAGTLAIRQNLSSKLAQLRVPVFSTASAKGVVDETLPHAANVFTHVGLDETPEHALMSEADLIVGIGLRPGELLATKPFPAPTVNFDAVNSIPGSEAFQFIATGCLQQIETAIELLGEKVWGIDLVANRLSHLDRLIEEGFLPGIAYKLMRAHLGPQVRYVLDTGYFCTIAEHAIRANSSDLCLMAGQGRYMGTAVPMALGALVAEPDKRTVAVVGDGGIGMYVGELRLALERNLPLLLVLMSDGRFGSVATGAIQKGFTQAPLTVKDHSWLSVMQGMGFDTLSASDMYSLDKALSACASSNGPAFLEINFPPEPYERMTTGIR